MDEFLCTHGHYFREKSETVSQHHSLSIVDEMLLILICLFVGSSPPSHHTQRTGWVRTSLPGCHSNRVSPTVSNLLPFIQMETLLWVGNVGDLKCCMCESIRHAEILIVPTSSTGNLRLLGNLLVIDQWSPKTLSLFFCLELRAPVRAFPHSPADCHLYPGR